MICTHQILVKGDFDIAYCAVIGTGLDAYLREISSFSARGLAVPILWQTNHTSVALILEAQTLPRNMTIFHLITLHILFQ